MRSRTGNPAQDHSRDWAHDDAYRALLRHALGRLIVLYFIPLLLLTVFFHLQYRIVARDADRRHRQSLAEHEGALLEMFLGDRLLNLQGLTDDAATLLDPRDESLAASLVQLQAASDAFVDLAVWVPSPTCPSPTNSEDCSRPCTTPTPSGCGCSSWLVRNGSAAILPSCRGGPQRIAAGPLAAHAQAEGRGRIRRVGERAEGIGPVLQQREGPVRRGGGTATGSSAWITSPRFAWR